MSGSLFRGLVFYLSVFMAFPPQVWTAVYAQQPPPMPMPQGGDGKVIPKGDDAPKKDEPGAKKDDAAAKKDEKKGADPKTEVKAPERKVGVAENNDRVPLRQAFHLASWRLTKILKVKLPGARKLREDGYHAILEPYQQCADPFETAPENLAAIDELVLAPVQKALGDFLEKHAEELNTLSSVNDPEPHVASPIELVESPANKRRCQPGAWRPESPTVGEPGSPAAWIGEAQKAAASFQEPFFIPLGKAKGPVTNTEIRRWIGWLYGLRDFRNLIARQYAMKAKKEGFDAAPLLKIPASIGEKVSNMFSAERADIVKGAANQIMSGAGVGDAGYQKVPRFVACDGKDGRPNDPASFCFQESVRPPGSDFKEDLIIRLQSEKGHGVELDTLRMLGTEGLMTELATVNTLLQKDAVPLEAACRRASDMTGLVSYYDTISKSDQKLFWVQQFSVAIDAEEKAYREGSKSIPVPREEVFYTEADKISTAWLDAYFKENLIVVPSAKGGEVTKFEDQRKARIQNELKSNSFRDRITEANRSIGNDFATLLSEKLKIWFALVQEDLGQLDESNRRSIITEMVREVVLYVLTDALEAHVLVVATEEKIEPGGLSDLWSSRFRLKWQDAMRSDAVKASVYGMADAIVAGIFAHDAMKKSPSGESIADEALTAYVRKITPQVRHAAQAEDTVRFMTNLVQWKNGSGGPGNFFSALLPGPWNYNWQLAGWSWVGPVLKKEFLSGSPRFFQLGDGDGHGYGYTLTPPDPRMYDDGYLHIQGALRSVAERRRDQLIKRLQERGYTDEMVRRMFTAQGARNTGVLADLILRKYGEVVDAQDHSDRGRYSENKTKAYTTLLNWLKSHGARAAYEQETTRLAKFIFDRYLRAMLDTADRSDAWKADLAALLKQIYENETYFKEPSVDAVSTTYAEYKKDVDEENKDSRWDDLKNSLKELEKETREKTDVFEGPKEFADWCKAKKGECEAWDKKASAIWDNEEQVRGLFESRVISATEKFLTDFLAQFGREGVLYDGTVPTDIARKTVLDSVKGSLFRAWIGWAREPRVNDHYRSRVDRLLKDASTRARTGRPVDTAILIRKMSSEVREKVQDMYDIWSNETFRRAKLVSDAVKSGNEAKLVAAQPEAAILYYEDLQLLSLQSPRRLALALFEKKLPDLLFVDFADFREQVSQRIQVAIAPQPDPGKELAKVDQRLKDLDDARWYLLNKSENKVRQLANLELESFFKNREDREEYKRLLKEIEFNEARKVQLKDKLKALVELRRIVRNYLGEIAEGKAALAEDDAGRRNEELWITYVNDQILMGLPTGKKGALVQKDISGKEMAMTPYRIIADLNDLSLAASRRLVVAPATGKNFIASVKNYCGAGVLPGNAAAFEKMYRAGLLAEFKQNVPMERVLSTLLSGWLAFTAYSQMPALEAYRERLKKLVALKPKAGLGATQFDTWFPELMKTAVGTEADQEKQLFESVPTGAEFCKLVVEKAEPLVAPVQGFVDAKKAIDDPTLEKYWELVEISSSILFTAQNRFAPLRDAEKKVVWLESGPTTEIAPALVPGGTGALPIRDRGVTEVLLKFAELPKVDAATWKKIFEKMPEPKSTSTDDRTAWVMGLHAADRRLAYGKLQSAFEAAVKKEAAAVVAPLFETAETPCLGLSEWHTTFRKHLLHWDRIKERLRAFAPPPPIRTAHTAGNAVAMGLLPQIGPLNAAQALMVPQPGLPVEAPQPRGSAHQLPQQPEFAELAKATFRLLVQYTPYRLEGNRLVLKPVPTDLQATLDAFDKATPEVRRRIIEDAEDLYNVETKQTAGRVLDSRTVEEATAEVPWRELYHRVRRPAACKMNTTAQQQLLAFYSNGFVADPADEIGFQVKSSGIEEWKRHYQVRTGFNQKAGVVDLMPFVFDYNMKAGGVNHVNRMESWLKLWGNHPKVTEQIKRLKALPKNPNASARLWDFFDSIEAFQKSDLYTQCTGLLRRHDFNSEAGFAPRTYQYFLATLNWNIHHYGVEPPIGPTPQAMAPGEFLLGKLLGDLVAVMDLELNNVAGWEKLFTVTGAPEGAQPEDWLLIAQSRRNTLVGAGERRFLGTMVEAPYTVSPNTVGANYAYRPFPIVDLAERNAFGTDRSFEEWYTRTEHPSLHQLYRVSASDEEKRPLYENIVALQGEIIGELDLQDGLATKRERFNKASADWDKHTFGNVQFTKVRVDGLVARANNAGLKTGDTEMRLLLGTREALADFRRTVSELNLKYEHESFRWAQGRGNDLVQFGLFRNDLQKAMAIFTKQMGSDEAVPNLPVHGAPNDNTSFAKQRRELIARAIFWAGQVAKKRCFDGATTKQEKDRLKAVVTVIDAFYLEEGQKLEVRRGLKTVAGNINKQLKALCEAQNLRNIKTDDELRKARKLVVEDTRLVYMDNLSQLMYFDSGIVENGKDSQVRRILSEMSRDLSASKQLANDVNTAVLWLVALSVMVLAFGYMNPALARVAFAPKAMQAGIYLVGMAAATGFAYIEIYQICEDFWGRPGEIELLTQIRDTHFTGRNPLMKDETGIHLQDARRLNLADQRSLLRWTFHVLGIIAGVQVMAHAYKAIRGGVRWALARRNPMRPVELRFRGHTVTLEIASGPGGAFATVDGMAIGELEGKLLEAYTKALKGTRGPGNTILIDEATMAELRKWAKKELDNLCRELNLNPRTLLPNDLPVEIARLHRWDPRRIAYEAQEAARAQSMPQLRWLQGIAGRPVGVTHALTTPELIRLAALGGEPAALFTPWYMSLFGLTNRSAMVRRFEKLRLIAQAEIDIMAVHHPQTMQILAFLQELNLGKAAVQKWELFTEALYTRITQMPGDLRSYFRELYRQAGVKADAHIARQRAAGRLDGMDPAQVELQRIEYIRGCFQDVFQNMGTTMDATRVDLVDAFYKQLLEVLLPKYGNRTFAYFQMHFLREKKLALEPAAWIRRETLNELIAWQQRAHDVVRRYAAEQGATESDVLYWILNREHPKYGEFRTRRPARPEGTGGEERVEASYGSDFPAATDPGTPPPPTYDIHAAATELRAVMAAGETRMGAWLIDMELCRAIAVADYRAMAARLLRLRRVSPTVLGERMTPEQEQEDFRPLDDRLPTRPDPTDAPVVGDAPGTGGVLDELLFGAAMRDTDALLARVKAVVPEANWDAVAALLKKHGDVTALMYEMGTKRAAGELTEAAERAYRLAIVIRQELQRAATIANETAREAYIVSALGYLRRLAAANPTWEMSVIEARGCLGLPVSGWSKVADIDAAARVALDRGVDGRVIDRALRCLRSTHPELRNTLDPTVWARVLNVPPAFVGDAHLALRTKTGSGGHRSLIEELHARLYNGSFEANGAEARRLLGLSDLATPEEIAERARRITVELEKLVNAAPDEAAKAVHRQAMARVAEAQRLAAADLVAPAYARALRYIREMQFGATGRDADVILARIQAVVPVDMWPEVAQLLARHPRAYTMIYELGVRRGFNRCSAALEARYRLAIAIRQELQRLAALTSTADREVFLRSALEYLRGTNLITATEMSVGEARGVLGLPMTDWPAFGELDRAAREAIALGKPEGVVNRALQTLQLTHPEARDLANPQVWCRLLNLPLEGLANQHVIRVIALRAPGRLGPADAVVEEMVIRLFGETFTANATEALLLLGLPPTATERAIFERMQRLVTELERCIEETTNAGAKAMYRTALFRVRQAHRAAIDNLEVLAGRARPAVPQTPRPVYERLPEFGEYQPVDLAREPYFEGMWRRLVEDEIVARRTTMTAEQLSDEVMRAMAGDLGSLRQAHLENLVGGRVNWGDFTFAERLMRAMHVASYVRHARNRGALTTHRTTQRVIDILMEHYVNAARLRFNMSIREAEEFIFLTFRKLNPALTRDQLKIYAEGRLPELRRYISTQRRAHAARVEDRPSILGDFELLPEGHLNRLEQAYDVVMQGNISPSHRDLPGELEALIFEARAHRLGTQYTMTTQGLNYLTMRPDTINLRSAGQMPMEVILALCREARLNPGSAQEIRRFLYFLLDHGHGYRIGTDWGHSYGDLMWWMFGPDAVRMPTAIDENNGRFIAHQIVDWLRYAITNNDVVMMEDLVRAAQKVPGFEIPQGALPMPRNFPPPEPGAGTVPR